MTFLSELAEIANKTPDVEPAKNVINTDFLKKFVGDSNKELTHRDAVGIIQQAEDDAEAEETVAFGLELDDGGIVKVYIKPDQADDFEKTMSDYLGQEDDVEKAINDLAEKFDIVSVEWPANKQPSPEGTEEVPSEENPEEDDQEEINPIAPEDGEKIKLGFSLVDKPNEEKPEEDDQETDTKDKEDTSDEDALGDEEPETKEAPEDDAEKDTEEDDGSEEEDDTEDDSNDSDLEDDSKDKKKKKKKKEPKVEEGYNPGANIRSRFITEENKDSIKIEHIFKSAFQRNIFKLILLLDFPVERLLLNKNITKNSIRNKALDLSSNNRAKMLIKYLIRELNTISDNALEKEKEKAFTSKHTAKDLQEAKDLEEVLTNKTQLLILAVIKALGVPEYVLTTRTNLLKQHLRRIAKIVSRHNRIKNYLTRLADVLGVLPKEDAKELKKEKLEEAVNLGADQYLRLVAEVLFNLGIPDSNIVYQKANLITALRAKEKTVNRTQVMNRLNALNKLLGNKELTTEELTIVESSNQLKDDAVNLGTWNIAQLGDKGLVLSVEHYSIKIVDTERFLTAIEEGHGITLKSGNDHYTFTPLHNGKEYVVSSEKGTLESPILLTKKTIENLINL